MVLEDSPLAERVAFVTGSTRGIGRALALALGEAGAMVVVNGRDADAAAHTVESFERHGIAARAAVGDVSRADAVATLVAGIEHDVGAIDILVNNAGVQHREPVLDVPASDFLRVLEVNLVAPFLVAQAVGRFMVERGRGKIINVASIMALVARPSVTPYVTSKGGLKMLTQGLCAELAPKGIQVNALAPGYFATDMTEALVNDPDFSSWVTRRTPAGRWGEVTELAGPVVFLASDASSYVNGHLLVVDGGMTAVV